MSSWGRHQGLEEQRRQRNVEAPRRSQTRSAAMDKTANHQLPPAALGSLLIEGGRYANFRVWRCVAR
jgi:hypothetical protein